ncbi:MAG: hypothetical protein QM479_13715 [Pseudomonadota bacterium]
MRSSTLLFISLFFISSISSAKEYVWLIGGGPLLDNSQAQIELNTKWVQQLISKYKPNAKTKVYFTDGNDPDSDVQVQINNKDSIKNLTAIARVFGAQQANSIRFYNHRVANVYASTEVNFLYADLSADFKKLKSDDSALIIFQGHGGLNKRDTSQNSLKLWKDTRLYVTQLEEILQQLDNKVPVRFILPQCFSGAFERLIYHQADKSQALDLSTRCGFFAEDAYEESEGCTSSINEQDYRDYSSYFFAALDGKTRTGEKLTRNPDRNSDHKISLTEAHFYSLTQAISTDLPRSTSESFLLNWVPWYFRWVKSHIRSNNIYSQLAQEVAQKNKLKLNANGQITNIHNLVKNLLEQKNQLVQSQTELEEFTSKHQQQIAKLVSKKWPYILVPNTKEYLNLLNTQSTKIQEFIIRQKNYAELVKAQDKIKVIVRQLLDLQRGITQLQKVNRLNSLANTLEYFNQHASMAEKQSYEKLVKCESMPF